MKVFRLSTLVLADDKTWRFQNLITTSAFPKRLTAGLFTPVSVPRSFSRIKILDDRGARTVNYGMFTALFVDKSDSVRLTRIYGVKRQKKKHQLHVKPGRIKAAESRFSPFSEWKTDKKDGRYRMFNEQQEERMMGNMQIGSETLRGPRSRRSAMDYSESWGGFFFTGNITFIYLLLIIVSCWLIN